MPIILGILTGLFLLASEDNRTFKSQCDNVCLEVAMKPLIDHMFILNVGEKP